MLDRLGQAQEVEMALGARIDELLRGIEQMGRAVGDQVRPSRRCRRFGELTSLCDRSSASCRRHSSLRVGNGPIGSQWLSASSSSSSGSLFGAATFARHAPFRAHSLHVAASPTLEQPSFTRPSTTTPSRPPSSTSPPRRTAMPPPSCLKLSSYSALEVR